MNLELLQLIRNVLLRCAVVCFGFSVIMSLATVALWDFWTGLTAQWFHTSADGLGTPILYFFAAVKFYGIFVLLSPGLALHWTIKSLDKKA
jgi:hypothetical protein